MKTGYYAEQDNWSKTGIKINSAENLEKICQGFEKGPIIMERWIYRGASSPERIIFEDYEDFQTYLNSEAFAGDSIYIWSFKDICRDDNVIASGKCPNDNQEVPEKGAY